MNELEQFLSPYRRDVLRYVRWAALVLLASYLTLSLMADGPGGIPAGRWVVLGLVGLYVVAVFLLRESNLTLQAFISTLAFFGISIAILYGIGPVYSAGLMFMASVAWYVFFHENFYIPVALVVASLVTIATLESFGLTPPWMMGDVLVSDWLILTGIPLVPLVGVAYLLQQILSGLLRSSVREADARMRELNMQREKELIDKALNQRYRLESIGRLSSGIAHDFNNVLTILMSCLELLRVVEDKTTREGILKDMEAAVRTAESTSRQLLAFSTNTGSPKQPADPRSSLRTIVSNLKRLFPENIVIEDYLRGTPRVVLETSDFEQTVLNLCINARDAMPDGGTISISCYEEPADNLVIVDIGDTGTGMSSDIMAKAMDPFFTTKIEGEGTGLGLSQVYSAIQNVGGDVEIDSQMGRGTRIRLILPVAEPGLDTVTPSGEEASPAEFSVYEVRDESVLLLDDDQMVSTTMTRALESAGFKVTSAFGVTEALSCLDDGHYDILITDRGLPDGDPARVVSKFKKLFDGRVLLISGYDLDPGDDPTVAFLKKPFAPSALLQRLESLRAAGSPGDLP